MNINFFENIVFLVFAIRNRNSHLFQTKTLKQLHVVLGREADLVFIRVLVGKEKLGRQFFKSVVDKLRKALEGEKVKRIQDMDLSPANNFE